MSSEDTDLNASGTEPDGYDLGRTLPIADTHVPRGSNILISGPSMLGKTRLVMELLGEAPAYGERSILVTTNDSASRMLSTYRRCCPTDDLSHLHVVDASGVSDGNVSDLPAERMETVSAPGDLTGIGIAVTKCVQGIRTGGSFRLGFISISTLLQYVELERAFSFMHVLTGRLSSAGELGLFTIDPSIHDAQTVNTMTTLFDGVVELRESDAGEREVRVRGIEGADRSWHPYPRNETE